jgi:N-methylhydantoinase B
MAKIDPITLEVVATNLRGIVREMQLSLYRTGYSTNIRESQDGCCGLVDRDGRLIAAHEVLFNHLRTFSVCVKELLKRYPHDEIQPGDAFIMNHPYFSGVPHSSDTALITPVFHKGELVAFFGSSGHKSDMGGLVPGSGSGKSREILHEGLLMPPTKYASDYLINKELEGVIRANTRTPDLVIGDIEGQIGVDRLGERRLNELMDKYGKDTVLSAFSEMCDRTEQRLRSEIARWEDGTAEAEAFLDNDGADLDRPVRLHVQVTKEKGRLTVDLTGSDPQTKGPANLRRNAAEAAICYGLIAATDPTIPNNEGLIRSIECRFAERSVLNPSMPGPTSCYATTQVLLTQVALSALLKLAKKKPIGGGANAGALIMGGRSTRSGYAYAHFELCFAGCGACEGDDGGYFLGSVRNAFRGVKAAPVEIIESEFNVRMLRWELEPDSGGAGKYRGGLSPVREYMILGDTARLSLRGDSFVSQAWGVDGGLSGKAGAGIITNRETGEKRRVHARVGDEPLAPGETFTLKSGGGGGVGNPLERDRKRVVEDLEDGYISTKAAREVYGMTDEEIEEIRKTMY